MILRRLLLCCLAVFCAGTLHAADNYVRDSLLVQLECMPHDELRLKTLYQLVRATQDDTEQCAIYNKQLLVEADKQDNDKFRCRAYFNEMVFAYNTYNSKRLHEVADVLIPLARKIKFYGTMFRAWRCKIDFMILTQDFERNEREAKRMLDEALQVENTIGILEAHQCLANLYNATYRKADAIATQEAALELARETDKVEYLKPIWQSLMMLYSETTANSKWLALLNEADHRIGKLPPDELRMQHLFLLLLYSNYTAYYTQAGNLDRAEQYMRRAEAFRNDASSPPYIIYFEKVCSQYYFKSEQYEQALAHVDVAIAEMRNLSNSGDYYGILPDKAHILNKMNRHEDAIRQLKEAIAFKDSLQVVTINKQYEQLRNDFNADQLLLEAAELRHRTQVYMLLLLIVGLTVIAGFVVYTLRSHRQLRLAEQQMRTMHEQMEQVNEAKNRFLSNISNTIREPLNTVVEGSLCLAGRQLTDTAEQQRLSVDIRQKSANLLTVINDILDLSRLEAGMMKFEQTDTEVMSLLMNAVSSQEDPEKIEIRPEQPENTLYMVRLDGNRLMQVFRSLLTPDSDRVVVSIREESEASQFRLHISGSALASPHPGQQIIIRNEINRMLLNRFDGTYTITSDTISLTLPFTEKVTPEAN